MSEEPEVIRCKVCLGFYNGKQYAQCPYCANSSSDAGAGVRKKKKWPWKKDVLQVNPPADEPEDFNRDQPVKDKPIDSEKDDSNENKEENGENEQNTNGTNLENTSIQKGENLNDLPRTVGYDARPVWMDPLPKNEPETDPEETKETPSTSTLTQSVDQLGKTIGKYVGIRNGQMIDPVVGWLIGVKGVYYGQAFPLKSGTSRVGRSEEMDIALMLDNSVSRRVVLEIVYDTKTNEFNAFSDNNDCPCYIDGNRLYRNDRKTLEGYEEFEFGDMERNKFVFVPLCGEKFLWSKYPA